MCAMVSLDDQIIQDIQLQNTSQSYLTQIFDDLSEQTIQIKTSDAIEQQQRSRDYLNTRMNFTAFDQLNFSDLIRISEYVDSRTPSLNTTQVYDQQYNQIVNTSKIMQTYNNDFASTLEIDEQVQCYVCNQLFNHVKPIQQNDNDNILIYDEITLIDKNLNTYIYPYNQQQQQYDARQTLGRFVYNRMNQVDIFLDLNVDQYDLQLAKVIIVDIVNMVTMNTSIHIYTIGSNINEIFNDNSDYIQLEQLLDTIQISSSQNFEQLYYVYNQVYASTTNITLSFLISKGIEGLLHYTKFNNVQFVLISPKYIKQQKYNQTKIQNKKLLENINNLKKQQEKQQIHLNINLQSLNATLIELNQLSFSFKSLKQVNDYFKIEINRVLTSYINPQIFLQIQLQHQKHLGINYQCIL
ncbi:Conserved_hypothetical protein [Hexamita inflata]|uniref:Uncharacterized protein n=1 Tax=Hexamita inflata TaxID=28002 RepID=A0AA86U7H9_9EUKA|nr:Conserved hypothetical protein [Hexamita inflata]